MKSVVFAAFGVGLMAMLVLACGCSNQASRDREPARFSGPPPAIGDGHDHEDDDHGNKHLGPHHGHVIELGRSHEYHAEIVENEETGTVTVYILDAELNELAIEQASIVMNLTVDSTAETFELSAVGGSNGKASRFVAGDRALFEALHEYEATGKLRVTIGGIPYTGNVEHHDHQGGQDDDHGHEHDNDGGPTR